MEKPEFLRPRILPKKSELPLSCKHMSIWVNGDTRMLECRQCGKVIDPFDFLEAQAKRNQRADTVTKMLREEQKRLTQEVDVLRKEKKSLQSAVRRLKKNATQ